MVEEKQVLAKLVYNLTLLVVLHCPFPCHQKGIKCRHSPVAGDATCHCHSVMILTFFSQDFDAWFNTNSLVEEKQLVERLHSVSTQRLSGLFSKSAWQLPVTKISHWHEIMTNFVLFLDLTFRF